MSGGTLYDPGLFKDIGGWIQDWLSAAKRATGHEQLCVFMHRVSGNVVLCSWVVEGKVIDELLVLDLANVPSKARLREIIRPTEEVLRERRQMMRDHRYMDGMEEEWANEEREDTAKWLKKQGMDDAAHSLQEGGASYHKGEDEHLDELVEELNTVATGRVITSG